MIRKVIAEEASGLEWFKSSYSDSSDGNDCVEVAARTHSVLVRDSKQASGPRLGFAPSAWAAFVEHASRG
ncbi:MULTISPECIES: DUF397 domain-containing protein [unclassified Streptomyces]|uniref:DUF397 domain-containing protein n=1 Tax=unclassified Streptomyces TaxID=2593676 RepID=UPI003C7C3F19